MKKLRLVLTGSARSATAFYAQYLTEAGLHCGHERFFSFGGLEQARVVMAQHWLGTFAESSWLAAPFLNCEELADALVIHLVRHPKLVIESMLRQPSETTPQYHEFRLRHTPGVAAYCSPVDRAASAWLTWNRLVETQRPDAIRFDVAREPRELLEILARHGFQTAEPTFDDRACNHHAGEPVSVSLADVENDDLRRQLIELSLKYSYEWPVMTVTSPPVIKAIVTTLDNLENLKETIPVLLAESLDEIVVVNNGSEDDTAEWLSSQPVTTIHRENRGAGPGRNVGLDAAGDFDFALMLDGGIRPLRGGVEKMLNYLRWTPGADVIGVEIADFETDREKAWRRWPEAITKTYRNTRLSHTAYCLCRKRAWNGLRFCEEGPFGEPGWGADDDEMAYRWIEAGVVVHVVTGVHPYRRASGSFRRLYRETGVWPNQYGSVYEKRVVWLSQNWPQHEPPGQWGEPWLTVVIRIGEIEDTARLIKAAHDALRERRFRPPYDYAWNPYHIVAWGGNEEWREWAEPRRLRQHHGDVVVLDEYGHGREIVERDGENEATWTGDFLSWDGDDWRDAVRPTAHYYGLVGSTTDLEALLARYDVAHPPQPVKKPPTERKEIAIDS